MNLQQLNPWNWFKHEEANKNSAIPVKRFNHQDNSTVHKQLFSANDSIFQLHREIDRLFDETFRGFGMPSLRSSVGDDSIFNRNLFDAKLNIGSDEKEYHVSLEAPGMTENDIRLELSDGVLIIRGEKKQENETKDKHYYCVERSFGNFQRVLSLPDDCDQEAIAAEMKNGVLDIKFPRKSLPTPEKKHIPISSGIRDNNK